MAQDTPATQLIVIAHNIRSAHNVGSIFRTCDGFGVQALYLTGYTPYPVSSDDSRPPHIRHKITAQITKTALGAELAVPFYHAQSPGAIIEAYRAKGFTIAALEQTPSSILLPAYRPVRKLVLLLGEEVAGVTSELLDMCDVALEIPMMGQKESFNVSVAAGIALYGLQNPCQAPSHRAY